MFALPLPLNGFSDVMGVAVSVVSRGVIVGTIAVLRSRPSGFREAAAIGLKGKLIALVFF